MSTATLQIRQQDFGSQVDAFLATAHHWIAVIPNLATAVAAVGDNDARVPVSINSSESQDTWVCSPHTTYARYAIEELDRLRHPLLAAPLRCLCRALGRYLWRARLDDAVGINNWLLSTNLYPGLQPRVLARWIEEALDRWPRHAVWFRSLNPRYTGDWLQALQAAGFTLIPSRQVYLYDAVDATAKRPQNLHRDLQLLRSTPLTGSDAAHWSTHDYERAAELYARLYLEKYSQLNPAYSAQFLSTWQRAGLLQMTGYRDAQGMLQAVIGVFVVGHTITAPIVGYETGLPQRDGLYRLLMATVYELAARYGYRINLSAGAAQFKRLRGGVGTLEYSAVYTRHLPAQRQRAIQVLAALAKGIGAPIMTRFEL